jgi:hypothetical protein
MEPQMDANERKYFANRIAGLNRFRDYAVESALRQEGIFNRRSTQINAD